MGTRILVDSLVPTPVETLVPGTDVNRPVQAPAPVLVGEPVVTGVPVPIPVNKGVAKMPGPNVCLNVGTWLGTRVPSAV